MINNTPIEHLGNQVMKADEVARLCRVNRKTVYDAFKRGELPGRKVGKLLRFSRVAVIEWLQGK